MSPPTRRIDSPQNARFKTWKRIAAGQVRKVGRTFAAGRRVVAELAVRPDLEGAVWLVPAGFDEALPGAPRPRFDLSPALFGQLDTHRTGYPLLEVPVADRILPLPESLPAGMYVALPTQDPVNVGAVVRTAVGLGAAGILLLPSCAHPFHPRSVRTSAGAVFEAALYALPALEHLAGRECPLLALDCGGAPLADFAFPPRFALLLGIEGPGLDGLARSGGSPGEKRVTMERVSLPIERIDSYNANVAAALAMYEWRRRGTSVAGR